MKDIITNLLKNRGISVSQGSDGRVEVPQFIIKAHGWDKYKEFFLYSKEGEILIHKQHNGDGFNYFGEFKISNGRLRIPYCVLKNLKYNLLVSYATPETIVLRPDNSLISADEFINNLNETQKKHLFNLLLGKPFKPEFLLLAEGQTNLFRLVGNPTMFRGSFISKEKKIYLNNEGDRFYLLPGILRAERNRIGFLLIGDIVFGCIKFAFNKQQIKIKDNVELLFLYSQFDDGHFRAFINPNSDIFNNDIETARQVCSNPEEFLLEHFEQSNIEEADRAWFISSLNIKGEK